MPKQSGLGRGLSSIFYDDAEAENSADVHKLRISELQPRAGQPRKVFDSEALSQLADSIATHGLIQPIIVRRGMGDLYEIVAGERRWRASKMAGLTEVPVVVIEADDQKTDELSLIENIQRENLNAVEESLAYKALLEEYDLTQETVAARVGKSRSTVTNSLRLLDLPEPVLKMVSDNLLSAGHARALLGLKYRSDIEVGAATVVDKGYSVRATEELVRRMNARAEKAADTVAKSETTVNYTAELEKKVRGLLGRKVKIVEGARVKRLELEYSDNDDLQKLLVLLCGEEIMKD
ncbi:MAG: ParB/RepB/Spo0J family partition protein [Clostridia bacterium]|nr:ParB/RepB/Spo0J family partition protein [Clostridia bacterium]